MNGDDNYDVSHYKEIIREQDQQLSNMKKSFDEVTEKLEELTKKNEELGQFYSLLQDENTGLLVDNFVSLLLRMGHICLINNFKITNN